MGKGDTTRAAIVEAAVGLTSVGGLEALSIGDLAGRLGMSKSGLFAHFGAKEALQRAVIDAAVARFTTHVTRPMLKSPRGLSRLQRFLELWLGWTRAADLPGGCPILIATTEFEERPGPVRDRLVEVHRDLLGLLARLTRDAMATGELAAETDPEQIAFEAHGIVQATYLRARLLDEADARDRAARAFAALIDRHRRTTNGAS
jgi:AcrR family transcriptional regulator